MNSRFTLAVLVCFAFLGCGDEAGQAPPRLTDDLDWVVRIVFADTHYCTAIVLSEHWLLTAGHCVEQALPDDRVEVSQRVFGEQTVLYEGAAELLLHPDYDGSAVLTHRWNDIALVGLRDGSILVDERPRLAGPGCSGAEAGQAPATLYAVGYGYEPDPATGLCSDVLGSKKRYDGFVFRQALGPVAEDPREIQLFGRDDALCGGDSGAPLMFDREGVPHVFAVLSGQAVMRAIFYGSLLGSKISWLDAATAPTDAPLRCTDLGENCWDCVE